jgi:hypothetical protein
MLSALADPSWQNLIIVGLVSAFSVLNYLFSTGVLYHRICHIED